MIRSSPIRTTPQENHRKGLPGTSHNFKASSFRSSERRAKSHMSQLATLSKTRKYGLQAHLTVYLLTTLAILLLLFEQSQLASRVNTQSTGMEEILVQQSVMAVLLGSLVAAYGWRENRWVYVLSAILFAGYSGTRLAAAFSQTLGLVPALEDKGIPISDYQGAFYLLALAAAICYLLTILLLRRSYGRLSLKQSDPHEMI